MNAVRPDPDTTQGAWAELAALARDNNEARIVLDTIRAANRGCREELLVVAVIALCRNSVRLQNKLIDVTKLSLPRIYIDHTAAHLDADVPEPEAFSHGDRFTPDQV